MVQSYAAFIENFTEFMMRTAESENMAETLSCIIKAIKECKLPEVFNELEDLRQKTKGSCKAKKTVKPSTSETVEPDSTVQDEPEPDDVKTAESGTKKRKLTNWQVFYKQKAQEMREKDQKVNRTAISEEWKKLSVSERKKYVAEDSD